MRWRIEKMNDHSTANSQQEHNNSYTKNIIHDGSEKILKNSTSNSEEIQSCWSSEKKVLVSKSEFTEVANVYDVASYILNELGTMTTMKLQKLVYYCQAWSLVWDEKPLFKEKIEAWANGPVVKELFFYHQGMFQISSVTIGNPDLLNAVQKATIDAVIEYYGDKSSQWLIDLTHMEEPWKKARIGLPISVRSNMEITLESMAEYYSSLLSDS